MLSEGAEGTEQADTGAGCVSAASEQRETGGAGGGPPYITDIRVTRGRFFSGASVTSFPLWKRSEHGMCVCLCVYTVLCLYVRKAQGRPAYHRSVRANSTSFSVLLLTRRASSLHAPSVVLRDILYGCARNASSNLAPIEYALAPAPMRGDEKFHLLSSVGYPRAARTCRPLLCTLSNAS